MDLLNLYVFPEGNDPFEKYADIVRRRIHLDPACEGCIGVNLETDYVTTMLDSFDKGGANARKGVQDAGAFLPLGESSLQDFIHKRG